jgi:ribonucleoside-diphosphate reductase alpha chain
MDSAVSKTCNIGDQVTFDEFKDVYMSAYERGCKGVTTFRAAGKRLGILVAAPQEGEGAACYIDPDTGKKTCE